MNTKVKIQRPLIGTVTQVSGGAGVIQDANKTEYYFDVSHCVDFDMPKLHATVTFMRDTDYQHTMVADLVKTSTALKAIA